MQRIQNMIEELAGSSSDRRKCSRVETEIPVEVLIVRQRQDLTEPVYVAGLVHNLSANGAILTLPEEVSRQHVWIRFPSRQCMYVEAELVRTTESPIPAAHTYGVEFSRVLNDDQFHSLLEQRSSASASPPAAVRTVSVGDVLDLGDVSAELAGRSI